MLCWVNGAPACLASHREVTETQQIPNRFQQWTIGNPVSMNQASGECFVPPCSRVILGSPGCPVSSKLHDRWTNSMSWSSASNYFRQQAQPKRATLLPTSDGATIYAHRVLLCSASFSTMPGQLWQGVPFARASGRIGWVWLIVNGLTWIKSRRLPIDPEVRLGINYGLRLSAPTPTYPCSRKFCDTGVKSVKIQ
jgi:hypothetical protein